MPRQYIAVLPPTLCSTTNELFALEPTMPTMSYIHRITVTTTSQQPQRRTLVMFTGFFGLGSGVALAVTRLDPGISAFGGTIVTNLGAPGNVNTNIIHRTSERDVRDGWDWRFDDTPFRVLHRPGDGNRVFAIEFETAPNPPIVVMGSLYFSVVAQ